MSPGKLVECSWAKSKGQFPGLLGGAWRTTQLPVLLGRSHLTRRL